MTRLDDRERRLALIASAAAVAVVGVAVVDLSDALSDRILIASIGLVLAGLLAVGARSRRRLPTGLAAVLVAFAAGPVLGFPFLCLAAWLLFRGGRAAAEEAARRRAEEDDGETTEQEPPRRRRRRVPVEATVEGPAGPARPTANKRYTPPRNHR